MAQCAIETCEICENSPRSRYCVDCEQYFCNTCELSHLRTKMCRTHIFVDFDKVNQEVKSTKCAVHNERYTYYCETCSCLLCHICLPAKHKKHDFSLIEEAASKTRPTLEADIQLLETNLQKILNAIDSLQNSKTEKIRQEKDTKNKVDLQMMEVVNVINKKGNDHLEEVKVQRFKQCTMLDKEIEKRQQVIKESRLTLENAKAVMSENSHVAILQSAIDTKANLEILKEIMKEKISLDPLPSFAKVSSQLKKVKELFSYDASVPTKILKRGDRVQIRCNLSQYGVHAYTGIVLQIEDGIVYIDLDDYRFNEALRTMSGIRKPQTADGCLFADRFFKT